MIITQSNYYNLVKFLLTNKSAKLDAAKSALATALKVAYEKTVPISIKTMAKKYPDYFSFVESITVSYTVNKSKSTESMHVPKIISNDPGWSARFTLAGADKTKILALKKIVDIKSNGYEQARKDLKNALLSLRSSKNIIKEFPESAEYFKSLPSAKEVIVIPVKTVDYSALKKALK